MRALRRSIPEADLTMPGVEEHEQPNGDEPIAEDRQEVVGRVIALEHRLVDVSKRCAEHEKRPAQSGRKPKSAADQDAQKAEDAPRAVVKADFELERTSRRPADEPSGFVCEENVRNEAEHDADDADVEHKSIKQKQPQDVGGRLRLLADGQMQERKEHAQNHDGYVDHGFPRCRRCHPSP